VRSLRITQTSLRVWRDSIAVQGIASSKCDILQS